MQKGTQHWLRTRLGQLKRIGEHISKNGKGSPDHETLMQWGEIVKDNSKEIIDYFEGKDLESLQIVKVVKKYYAKANISFPLYVNKISIEGADVYPDKTVNSIKQLKGLLNINYKGIQFSSWSEDIWCSNKCEVEVNNSIKIKFK